MDKEENVVGYCESCGNEITKKENEAYVDQDGHYFCSIECVLEYYEITKVEI